MTCDVHWTRYSVFAHTLVSIAPQLAAPRCTDDFCDVGTSRLQRANAVCIDLVKPGVAEPASMTLKKSASIC